MLIKPKIISKSRHSHLSLMIFSFHNISLSFSLTTFLNLSLSLPLPYSPSKHTPCTHFHAIFSYSLLRIVGRKLLSCYPLSSGCTKRHCKIWPRVGWLSHIASGLQICHFVNKPSWNSNPCQQRLGFPNSPLVQSELLQAKTLVWPLAYYTKLSSDNYRFWLYTS